MKTLIADKFSEAHLARLSQLGCEVAYKPNAKAEDLPGLNLLGGILDQGSFGRYGMNFKDFRAHSIPFPAIV